MKIFIITYLAVILYITFAQLLKRKYENRKR